jgi:hypothetical protein
MSCECGATPTKTERALNSATPFCEKAEIYRGTTRPAHSLDAFTRAGGLDACEHGDMAKNLDVAAQNAVPELTSPGIHHPLGVFVERVIMGERDAHFSQ